MDDEDGPQEIIDEDELALLQRMKELKKNYRACYADLKTVKGTSNKISQSIDQCKQKLVSDFEMWYDDNFDANASTQIEAWNEYYDFEIWYCD